MTYLLRDIDAELWRRARAKAAREGRSMADVLRTLIAEYVAESVDEDAVAEYERLGRLPRR